MHTQNSQENEKNNLTVRSVTGTLQNRSQQEPARNCFWLEVRWRYLPKAQHRNNAYYGLLKLRLKPRAAQIQHECKQA